MMEYAPDLWLVAGIAILLILPQGVSRGQWVGAGVVALCGAGAWHAWLASTWWAAGWGAWWSVAVCVVGCGVLGVAWDDIARPAEADIREWMALYLCVVWGITWLVRAEHVLSLYLGLELSALPVYALLAMERGRGGTEEAAVKYFVLGALASALFLWGASWLYGLTGTLSLPDLQEAFFAVDPKAQPAVMVACAMMGTGLAFKLGLAPAHMWLPDVYEGATPSMALMLATLSKMAAFGFMVMCLGVVRQAPEPVLGMVRQGLVACAVLSLCVGNLFALWQEHVRRLLGFSAVSHAGLMALGWSVWLHHGSVGDHSLWISVLYAGVYVLTAGVALGVVVRLERMGWSGDVAGLRGLHHRHPVWAWVLAWCAVSWAGLPPTLGFYAKWVLLSGLMATGSHVLVAVVLGWSVVGAFYYLRLIKAMYFEEPAEAWVAADGLDWMPVRSRVSEGLLVFQTMWLMLASVWPAWVVSVSRWITVN